MKVELRTQFEYVIIVTSTTLRVNHQSAHVVGNKSGGITGANSMNVNFGKNKLLGNNTVKSHILNDETFYKTF